jgi:hypothetical protein
VEAQSMSEKAVIWPTPITIVWPPPATEDAPAIPRHAVDPVRRPRKAHGARKPSVARMIAVAKKAGATSVTTPAGYRITFGELEPAPANELDEWVAKHARPPQRH